MNIKQIIISQKYVKYLQDRQLVEQYKKAKKYMLEWDFKNIDLKIRQPKSKNIYYFRLNKQFRVFGIYEPDTQIFKVKSIDNHQN